MPGVRQWMEPKFFKPILPPFQQLSIPRAFLKHLVDEMCDEGLGEATLKNHRCAQKSWRVKVKGFCFTEGWDNFVHDNDLGLGDFVVFAYKGAMIFDVKVFDRSSCEKEYHHLPATAVKREAQKQLERDDNRLKGEEIKSKFLFTSNCSYKAPPATAVTKEALKQQEIDDSRFREEEIKIVTNSPSGPFMTPCNRPKSTQDSFEVFITDFKTLNSRAGVPKDFVVANGIIGKIFQAILRDERGNSWSVGLNQYRGRVRMGRGWRRFLSGNYLKEGDTCVFKLVNWGKIRRGVENAIVLDVTVLASSDNGDGYLKNSDDHTGIRPNNPFFVISLRPYNLKQSRLIIPLSFARRNGLMGKHFTTTLRDRKGKSWRMRLRNKCKGRIYLCGDWFGISAENGLKEGDTCKFELIRRAKLQVMEFRMLS